MPDSLADVLSRHTRPTLSAPGPVCQRSAAIEAVTLWRLDAPSALLLALYRPSLCVVVQGAKRITVGDLVLDYAPGQCLVAALDLPVEGGVTQASAAEPYLSVELALDPVVLADVARAAGVSREPGPAAPLRSAEAGVFVGGLAGEAAAVFARLVRLLDRPEAVAALYEPTVRELYYWLLVGPDGDAFARLALPDGRARRVALAVGAMRRAFPGPVRVGDLATEAGMSASTFTATFRAVTGRSPLQYYKQLRLLEARRQLVAGTASAKEVAYTVGYASPSQFSREYARTFGVPPGLDRHEAASDPD